MWPKSSATCITHDTCKISHIGEKRHHFLHIELLHLLHYCNNIFGAQLIIIAIINNFFGHYCYCYCNDSEHYCQLPVPSILFIISQGYPNGYAQLIHSPDQWIVEPMQIDTHNRNFSINDQVGLQVWLKINKGHSQTKWTDWGRGSLENVHIAM